MKIKNLSRGSLLLVMLLTGCLFSGTFVITFHFIPGTPDFVNGLVKECVDLSSNTTWDDHSDDIKRIDKITFDAVISNNVGAADTLSVYIAATTTAYTTAAQVEGATDVYPILLGYVTSLTGSDVLTVLEADALLQLTGSNFESVKALVESGAFCVYITSTGATSGSIDEANVYITFTAG